MANGNGTTGIWKWIAGTAVVVLFALWQLLRAGDLSAVKDSVAVLEKEISKDTIRIEARVDKNTADVIELKGDVKLIKYQTDQIITTQAEVLKILKEIKKDSN